MSMTGPALHAVVLAAGLGSRFGGGKLHAIYRKRPLLSHVLEVVEDACQRGLLQRGHVVIAGHDGRAQAMVRATPLHPILNDDPAAGLSGSLRLGLVALERHPSAAGAMVFLADQPEVRMEVVEQLVHAWQERRSAIIRPRYAVSAEAPGHPVVLAREVWPRALTLEGDAGFGALLVSESGETDLIDASGDNPDVDTPADLQALEESSREA